MPPSIEELREVLNIAHAYLLGYVTTQEQRHAIERTFAILKDLLARRPCDGPPTSSIHLLQKGGDHGSTHHS